MSPALPDHGDEPRETRLFVHFRSSEPIDLDATESGGQDSWKTAILSGVRDLDGLMSGWGDDCITVDFPRARVLEAVRLLSSGVLAPDLSVGVAAGTWRRVALEGGLSLCEGEGMRGARRLSEAALPGEVLVSAEIAKSVRLRAFAEAPRRALREELGAVSLDLESPILEGTPEVESPSGIPEVPSESPISVSGEALRRYRAEKIASKKEGGLGTCRASLALAVALAQIGRENEAILEALEGLSWARETNDARGERACALFLVKCADRQGEPRLAETWAEVARSRANV